MARDGTTTLRTLAGTHRRVSDLDLVMFSAVAGHHTPWLDPVLPRLSRAANYSTLWLGLAGALAVRRGRTRRAAIRGLGGLALASTVTNTVLKGVSRRKRPAIDLVLHARRLPVQPRSSSFPSGHSASAAGFVTGVAMELGWVAAPIVALGAAVAYSRVYTGVHYPGDVSAGFAVGVCCALATQRTWPVNPRVAPSLERPVRRVSPRPRGEGLVVVANPRSGPNQDEQALPRAELPAMRVMTADEGQRLDDLLSQAASSADVLGIAGGDGSVACAADVALQAQRPLAVFPGGTYNHFARDVGVLDAAATARAVQEGTLADVDVAEADGKTFLNTLSVGGYPEMVARRDQLAPRLGTIAAAAAALGATLRHAQPHRLRIDGQDRLVWLVFVGNCRYDPPGLVPAWREQLDDGLLDVRLIRAERRWSRTRLVAAVLAGRLEQAPVYEQWVAQELDLEALDQDFRYACDGELSREPVRRLQVRKRGRLPVYRPAR